MSFLTAYIDESASDLGERTFALCGYADFSEKWLPFTTQWAAILDESPTITYFRSAEAANLEGQFKTFSVAQRDDKVKKLLGLICSFRPVAILSGVRGKDYDELLRQYPDALMPPDPYLFCLGNIFSETCDMAQELGASQVTFVFDRNDKMEAQTHEAYQYARKQVSRFRIYFAESIMFADKRQQKPLQAADSIAYDFNKMFRLRVADPKAKMRKSLGVITEHCSVRGIEWDREWLEKMFVKRTRTKNLLKPEGS